MANLPKRKGQKRGVGGGVIAFAFMCLILVFPLRLWQQEISKSKMLNAFLSKQPLPPLSPKCGQHVVMERSG